MKNLKKVLALALAFAMAFSMFASAAFTDAASINADHADDVAMLVELGVLGGYPDGSFKPENTITRAEFTKMAYTIKYGYDDAGKLFAGSACKFTDVPADSWAKGYINYCANQGIIGGVGNNKFNPNGNVTVAEAAKMLLVILGCDAAKEGYGGSNWMGNVVSDAMELGVFDGWVGDPTAPATRQLVATLMANTIFANTYVYSPITGIGSQKNPLDPSKDNETLGAKTMGLKYEEGIVVANNTWFIDVDEDGETITPVNGTLGQTTKEGTFTLAYEELNTKTNELEWKIVDFEADLGSEYIGAKASVYYTVKDGKTNIIGDVVVSADTVMYEVTTDMIEIMPKADEDASARKILPYISIDVGDKEYQVKTRLKENRDADDGFAGNEYYDGKDLLNYFYFPVYELNNAGGYDYKTSGRLVNPASATDAFYDELKDDGIQSYRVVSLDGGKTISYIFRNTTKALGEITVYKPELDMITVGKASASDLEENLIVEGEIAKGDDVVYWKDGDKLFVCATEEVTGKATILDKNVVSIGENEYMSSVRIFDEETKNTKAGQGIAYYFTKPSMNTDTSKYIAYNGFLLNHENKGATADVAEYAVVLQSQYDDDEGTAKVRLGFTDETAGTYYVNKVNNEKVSKKHSETAYYPAAWNADQFVGVIFQYTINSDGTVNLYSDEETVFDSRKLTARTEAEMNKMGINADLEFVYDYDANDGKATAYSFTEGGVVFVLYGGGDAKAAEGGDFDKISAAVFKADELEDQFIGSTMYSWLDGKKNTITTRSYVKDVAAKGNKIAVAAFPYGTNKPVESAGNGAPIGYVLNKMTIVKDEESGEYYTTAKLLTADGIVEIRTVNDITTNVSHPGNKTSYGSILEVHPKTVTEEDLAGEIVKGSIITYNLNDEGLIENITLKATPKTMESNTKGWMMATITSVNDAKITYYPYSTTAYDLDTDYAAEKSKKTPDKYDVIVWAMDSATKEYVEGGEIEVLSGDEIEAKMFNALIYVNGNFVEQVISLYNNF